MEPVVLIENLCQRFADPDEPSKEHEVLSNLSLRLEDNRIIGLIGPSGGGKSVLLKLIAGIYPPTSGSIAKKGGDTSLMFQEGALFDSLNVFDNVAFPLVNGRVPTTLLPRRKQEEVGQNVKAILSRVGLVWAAHKATNELSGGMKRRVSLARALVTSPDVALLDDPTAGLDPVASSVIMDLIVEMQRESQATTVIASHDLRRLLPLVDEIVALFRGKIVFQGSLEELRRFDDEEVKHFVSCRYDLSERSSEGDRI